MPKQKLETIYVSPETHGRLKEQALRNHRTIGKEVETMLDDIDLVFSMLDELDKIAGMNVPVLEEKKMGDKS